MEFKKNTKIMLLLKNEHLKKKINSLGINLRSVGGTYLKIFERERCETKIHLIVVQLNTF